MAPQEASATVSQAPSLLDSDTVRRPQAGGASYPASGSGLDAGRLAGGPPAPQAQATARPTPYEAEVAGSRHEL